LRWFSEDLQYSASKGGTENEQVTYCSLAVYCSINATLVSLKTKAFSLIKLVRAPLRAPRESILISVELKTVHPLPFKVSASFVALETARSSQRSKRSLQRKVFTCAPRVEKDIDNINLSSPYHVPSGKNLLSGSYWRLRKKNYWPFWSPGISTQNQGTRTKSALPLKLDHSSIPTEKCRFFCLRLPASHRMSQAARTMTSSALVSYDRCSGVEPTPNTEPHIVGQHD
jgi:hypothetical protein